MIGVPQAAALAGVELHDYGRPGSSAVLVTSGTGLMLSIMDAAPCLRWCLDLDTIPSNRDKAFFLNLIDGETHLVAIAGWWMISDPTPVRESLRRYRSSRVITYANVPLGGEQCRDLEHLIAELRSIELRPARPPTVAVARGR